MRIIGFYSQDAKIYRILVGPGTVMNREFHVYACDEHEAIDFLADYCVENGFHGLYSTYDELYDSFVEQASDKRAQVHKLTCCGKDKVFIEIKEISVLDSDSISDIFWNCVNECEFYDICLANKLVCVKNTYKQLLESLSPQEEAVIRLTFGIECSKEDSVERIMKEIGANSQERVKQILSKALRKLRHPHRARELRSADMRIILFSAKKSNYSRLWKAIFGVTATKSKLLGEALLAQRREKEQAIKQAMLRQATFEKNKLLKQENIADDTTVTECCFGTIDEIFENNICVHELIKQGGAQIYELCKYKKSLFAEVVCVLASHGLYFFDYDKEKDNSVRAYIQRICEQSVTDVVEYFKNASIDILHLSTIVSSSLKRIGVSTIGDMLDHTAEEIKCVPCIGEKQFDEILEALSAYNLELKSEETVYMRECTGETKRFKLETIPLEVLELPDHTHHCLKDKKINTLDDLVKLTYNDILNINGLDQKNVDEVVEKLSFYI